MAELLDAVDDGGHREILVAMRDSLAAKIEETSSGRDYAAMMKSLMVCEDRIYAYDLEHGAYAPNEDEPPAAKARARRKNRVSDE